MIDAWPLLAVIALFYILEGLWWAPVGAVCFSRGLWGRFRCSTPVLLRRDALQGLIPPRHLFASGYRFLACPWPLAISPDGIAAPERLADESPPLIPYEDVRTLRIAGARFLHQGKIFANAVSPAAAREFMQLLQELATLDSQERANRITESIDGALGDGEVRRRMRRLRWSLRHVDWLPLLIFGNLFVLGPTCMTIFGLSIWPVPVALHIVLSIKVLVVFSRTANRLLPNQQEDRFATSLMLLLFPPATARDTELLSRNLLLGLHPLAVFAAVLDKETFRHYARRTLLEIQTKRTDDTC